jgi:hypothetical protein
LTEGDIIQHFTGDTWMVITEPEYTNAGITFDVMYLDVETPYNPQKVSFAPSWSFILLDYQPTRGCPGVGLIPEIYL